MVVPPPARRQRPIMRGDSAAKTPPISARAPNTGHRSSANDAADITKHTRAVTSEARGGHVRRFGSFLTSLIYAAGPKRRTAAEPLGDERPKRGPAARLLERVQHSLNLAASIHAATVGERPELVGAPLERHRLLQHPPCAETPVPAEVGPLGHPGARRTELLDHRSRVEQPHCADPVGRHPAVAHAELPHSAEPERIGPESVPIDPQRVDGAPAARPLTDLFHGDSLQRVANRPQRMSSQVRAGLVVDAVTTGSPMCAQTVLLDRSVVLGRRSVKADHSSVGASMPAPSRTSGSSRK